jgi:hypothetical protein
MYSNYDNHSRFNDQHNWRRGAIRPFNERENLDFDNEQNISIKSTNYDSESGLWLAFVWIC